MIVAQTTPATTTKTLHITQITVDRRIQARESIDEDAVKEYAEAQSNGAVLPAIVVFKDEQRDGPVYRLADGFHRIESAKRSGATSVRAEVRLGTRRDAMLFAIGANSAHGLRRTNADKRRAVEMLLGDDKWGAESDRWIAEAAHVSHTFVAKLREPVATLPLESDQADGANITESTTNSGEQTTCGAQPNRQQHEAPPPAILAYKKIDEQIGKVIRLIDELLPGGERHDRLLELAGEFLDQLTSYRRADP